MLATKEKYKKSVNDVFKKVSGSSDTEDLTAVAVRTPFENEFWGNDSQFVVDDD